MRAGSGRAPRARSRLHHRRIPLRDRRPSRRRPRAGGHRAPSRMLVVAACQRNTKRNHPYPRDKPPPQRHDGLPHPNEPPPQASQP